MSQQRKIDHLRINLQTKSNIIDKIKENMGKRLIARFSEGLFDHFLKFSITNQSSKLLLHLIQRMCKSKSTTQLHFMIGGRVLKFGLREFTLITNMNYNEILDVNTEDIKGGGRLQRIYFETLKSVTKHI